MWLKLNASVSVFTWWVTQYRCVGRLLSALIEPVASSASELRDVQRHEPETHCPNLCQRRNGALICLSLALNSLTDILSQWRSSVGCSANCPLIWVMMKLPLSAPPALLQMILQTRIESHTSRLGSSDLRARARGETSRRCHSKTVSRQINFTKENISWL